LRRKYADTARFGGEVGQMYDAAMTVKGAECSDQVKPEQLQVGQVVFGQRFRFQVGVQQA